MRINHEKTVRVVEICKDELETGTKPEDLPKVLKDKYGLVSQRTKDEYPLNYLKAIIRKISPSTSDKFMPPPRKDKRKKGVSSRPCNICGKRIYLTEKEKYVRFCRGCRARSDVYRFADIE